MTMQQPYRFQQDCGAGGRIDDVRGENAAGDDGVRDLERMLELLRRLPEVEGLPSSPADVAALAGGWPRAPIEVRLTLAIESHAPHLGFVDRLLGLIRQVVETEGVAITPPLLRALDGIARHAGCVAEAWQQIQRQQIESRA